MNSSSSGLISSRLRFGERYDSVKFCQRFGAISFSSNNGAVTERHINVYRFRVGSHLPRRVRNFLVQLSAPVPLLSLLSEA